MPFTWNDERQTAFDKSKTFSVTANTWFYRLEQTICALYWYCSNQTAEAILFQNQCFIKRVISYGGRKLTDT